MIPNAIKPLVLAGAFSALLVACATEEPEPPILDSGQLIVERLVDGDVRTFSVQLERAEMLRVLAEQEGVDVTMELLNAKGQLVDSADSLSGPTEAETLLAKAQSSGPHLFRLTAIGEQGVVRLRVETLGPGTAEDEALYSARLIAKRLESPEALAELEAAIEAMPKPRPPLEEGRLWHISGVAKNRFGDLTGAFEDLVRARELIAAHSNDWELGALLNDISDVTLSQGLLAESRRWLDESIEVSSRVENPFGLAVAWNNLAIWHAKRFELSEAIDAYHRAEDWAEVSQDWRLANQIRRNLGINYLALGRIDSGLDILRRAEADLRNAGRSSILALTLSPLAWAWREKGETGAAEAAYDEAVEMIMLMGTPQEQAAILEQRAAFRLEQGQPQEALDDIDGSRQTGFKSPGQEAFLGLRTGQALAQLGRLEQALPLLQQSSDVLTAPQVCSRARWRHVSRRRVRCGPSIDWTRRRMLSSRPARWLKASEAACGSNPIGRIILLALKRSTLSWSICSPSVVVWRKLSRSPRARRPARCSMRSKIQKFWARCGR